MSLKEWEKLEKISAWNLTKVRSKKEVIDEARTNGAKVHFASLMDICHLKNAELEAKHQKYKGRVVLRGDIVKDDPGSFAVFTEQGSSASQMTAAKVMDIISRLPGCDGQAADEISKDIVDNYRTMFESRISEGGTEQLPYSENFRISSWSYDMEGHAKKCVERYCELSNKTTQQFYKVSTPCFEDHHFQEDEMKSVGEMSQSMLSNCSEMFLLGTNWKT